MALNYTIHPRGDSETARPDATPRLPHIAGEALALDTPSAAIQGPCEIRANPDEDVTLDAQADSGDLDSAASPLVLRAGLDFWFNLPKGDWYIQATAKA